MSEYEYESKLEIEEEMCCQALVSRPINQVLKRQVAKRHQFTLFGKKWLQLGLYKGKWQ